MSPILAQREGAFVDAGANIGQTLANFLQTGLRRRYVGFEPNVRCVAFVADLIARNRIPDADILALALWNSTGTTALHMGDHLTNDQTASLQTGIRPGLSRVQTWVPTAPFDDVRDALTLERVALIKIDVEGAEYEVLQGMHRSLQSDQPAIFCEVLLPDPEADLDAYRRRTAGLAALLRAEGYRPLQCVIDGDRLRALRSISDFPLDRWSPERAAECDYVFAPEWLDTSRLIDGT